MSNYRIKSVSKITNIPVDTIRNWEKRYDFLKPTTGLTGEKLYSDEDIEILRRITVLLKSGGRISEIASKVFDSDFIVQADTLNIRVGNEVQLMIEEYYQSMLDLDLRKIEQIENLIEITVVFKNRLDHIYYPLLERSRRDSATGSIRIAQEHFITEHIFNKMRSFLSSSSYIHDSKKCSLICASPSSSTFEGGMLALACSMKLKGYNIYYFGANLRVIEIKDLANKIKPSVLALSIHDPEELNAIIKLYKDIKSPVVVGGIGVRLADSQENRIGAIHLIANTGGFAVDKLEAVCIEYFDSLKSSSSV